jgi:hypothetical protein
MQTSIDEARPDRLRLAAPQSPATSERRALLAGTAVLALTSIHHVYGAVHYGTPERYHAVFIAAVALALILGPAAIARRRPASAAGRAAWWTSWGVNGIVSVLLFGAVEGFYNHVVKVVAYFGGASEERLRWLFRDPLYEMPNDAIFEVTGVLQVVPAAFAAYYLARAAAAVCERSPPGPSSRWRRRGMC